MKKRFTHTFGDKFYLTEGRCGTVSSLSRLVFFSVFCIITRDTSEPNYPRSAPTLELHSRTVSNVSVTSPFQRSQHRKQFWRKVNHKKRESQSQNLAGFVESLLRMGVLLSFKIFFTEDCTLTPPPPLSFLLLFPLK